MKKNTWSRVSWHQLETVPEHSEGRIWHGIHDNPYYGVIYEIIYKPICCDPYPEEKPYCLVRCSDGEKLGFFASLDQAMHYGEFYL